MSELSNITFKEVCDSLEGASNVLILTHGRPDGDTLGSAFALRTLLRGLGKRAEVINSEKSLPKRLQFIFGVESLRPETLPADFTPEYIVSVDVSTSKLLDSLEEAFYRLRIFSHKVIVCDYDRRVIVEDFVDVLECKIVHRKVCHLSPDACPSVIDPYAVHLLRLQSGHLVIDHLRHHFHLAEIAPVGFHA